MAGNSALSAAAKAKKDEFYTQLHDIEVELSNYTEHFNGKTVLCNCDDPFESNFFKYFALNFENLGLKKLIATSYNPSPIAGKEFSYRVNKDGQTSFLFGDEALRVCEDVQKAPYKAVVTTVRDATGNGGVAMVDVAELFKMGENKLTQLEGDGDFRSAECLALLDEADIVVTNPPFSLFREYVAMLVEHDKKFIIIGNKNAITYKEIFPLLKENKIWLGYGFEKDNAYFSVPPDAAANYAKGVYDSNTGLVKFRNCCWFTNLDIKKRHEELVLVKRYNPEKFPKYDNYDAINVDKTIDIPCDYSGVMGVPITFIDKYNPDQFEIIWQACGNSYGNAPKEVLKELKFDPTIKYGGGLGAGVVNGKAVYARMLIRYTKEWIANHPFDFREAQS